MATLDALKDLSVVLGPAGAVAAVVWFFEHRARKELERRLLKLATSQLQANGEFRATLEGIREILRNGRR